MKAQIKAITSKTMVARMLPAAMIQNGPNQGNHIARVNAYHAMEINEMIIAIMAPQKLNNLA